MCTPWPLDAGVALRDLPGWPSDVERPDAHRQAVRQCIPVSVRRYSQRTRDIACARCCQTAQANRVVSFLAIPLD